MTLQGWRKLSDCWRRLLFFLSGCQTTSRASGDHGKLEDACNCICSSTQEGVSHRSRGGQRETLCVAKKQEITLVPQLPQCSLLAVFVWLLYCKQQMLWRPALIHVWTINEPHLPKKKAWILCKVTTFHPSIHKNVKVSRLYILWDTETQKCGLLPSNCGIDLTGMGVRLDPSPT